MPLSDKVRAYFSQPIIVRMAVIDSDGYPHVVPVWVGVDGDDLVIISFRRTRKNDYLQANPKGSLSAGGDPAGTEGYLLKGEFSLEDDIAHRWLREITYHYETKEDAERLLTDWEKDDMVVIRLKVSSVTNL
jgi:hypothetical protein